MVSRRGTHQVRDRSWLSVCASLFADQAFRECCNTGKHYIDLTGEQTWLAHDIIPRYNYLASKTGARIVPSCGFDSIPS